MNKGITYLFTLIVLLFARVSAACPVCGTMVGQGVRKGIFNHDFLFYLLCILFIFTLFIIVAKVTASLLARHLLSLKSATKQYNVKSLELYTSMIIGGTLAGFFDGIVFHQILQAHSMISNIKYFDNLINLEINMFWDGMFHFILFLMLLYGLKLFWKMKSNYRLSANSFLSGMLMGAGIFNVIEGVIDHQILQLHHVLQRLAFPQQLLSDDVFLIVSIMMVIVGFLGLKQTSLKDK